MCYFPSQKDGRATRMDVLMLFAVGVSVISRVAAVLADVHVCGRVAPADSLKTANRNLKGHACW